MEREFRLNWTLLVEEAIRRRHGLNLTQKQLAALAKVSTPTVSRFEQDDEDIQLSSVLAILGAIVGEFVGARAGLGMLLMQYNQSLETASLFSVILILGVIGFLMNYAVRIAERRLCFWTYRADALARP